MRLALLALLPVAVAAASVAHAADPADGTVSAGSPTVSWTGTVVSSGVTDTAWQNDPSAPCQSPSCDRFTLNVADSANLVIRLKGFRENTAGGDPGCGIRIIDPAGTNTYHSGTCGPKTEMKVTVKNAATGAYTIDVADSHVAGQPEDYEASATLAVPPPPPTLSPAVAPAPSDAAPPAPPTLTAQVATQSVRKLLKKRRFTVKLAATAPLSGVNAFLVRGKRRFGSGRLDSLDGTGKLVVRVKRKLKKGTYQLSVGGRDAQGRNVVTTAKLRVKR